ncbi:proton-conducting transporter membrane subunit [Streptomyces pactum]|uniref:NADH dehydrogenase n=1 Tax=Streptomyces pactum TaxID=68249 RepID=A0A1S6J4M6_9ACTN|nr:proton-conducting transporter membrane subunit [Streptomyces pactum]AQS66696.1 NADH dehydrogenase [Streptomyces pactum]
MSALLWLLVALPLGAGTALALAGARVDRPAPALGGAVAVATLGLAAAVAVARPETGAPLFAGMRAGLAVDGLSAVLVVTVAAVTTAVLVFAAGEFGRDENRGRFFGLMLVFAGAMLVTVTATTLPLLLMAWEVMGAASWALIGHWWRQPERVRAADVAFLTTRTADLGLYLAAGAALAGGAGSLSLDALPHTSGPSLHLVTAGAVTAALGKSAQLPFSFWLSRAMQGPSPVSALLHSATMVAAGAYLLLRLNPLLAATGWAGPLVAWTGAVTALALGVVAVAQSDLKQLLAASTSAQIGFMVTAAGTGGIAAGTAQLVAHAATKSALFLAAGAWLTALGTKRLPALRGAARRYRLVGGAFVVGALTLAGLPPLSLWAAKDEVLASARADSTGLYAVGLAAAAVAAVYSVKAVWYVTRPLPEKVRTGPEGVRTGPGGVRSRAGNGRTGLEGVRSRAGNGRTGLEDGRAGPGNGRTGPEDGRSGVESVRTGPEGVRSGAENVRSRPEDAPTGYDTERRGTRRTARTTPAPLLVLTLAAAGLGVLALPGPAAWLKRLVGAPDEPSPQPWELGLSAGVVFAAAALAWWRSGRPAPAPHAALRGARGWLCLERAARALVVRPVLGLARALARFDDRVVDGAVRQVARGGTAAAGLARRLDDGAVDGAVRAVAAGARNLGRQARRPQTGLLHQYYAQAAVGFAVLVLIILLVR